MTLLGFLILALSAEPALSQQQPVGAQKETTTKTPSGASFTSPPGWSIDGHGTHWVLSDPSRELTETLVEVQDRDPERAILSAWKLTNQHFDRKIKQVQKPPTSGGWESEAVIRYETTTAESRRILAAAFCKGPTCYVTLVDGTTAAMDRRRSQINEVIQSFRPPGLVEESFKGKPAAVLDAKRLEEIDAFFRKGVSELRLPGAALAIVQNGRMVHATSVGVRELGKPELVTPQTRFLIGSITKPLTSLLMARLVDEGILRWDEPATSLLPTFALGDADATRRLELWHTVCACTGLPRRDLELVFRYESATPESRVAELRDMKPTTGFGETFQYSNHLVAAGGYLAAHALDPKADLGTAYDHAMAQRIFAPLGMTSTTLDFVAGSRAEHASPHNINLDGNHTPIPLSMEHFVISVRPAGGVWSTVEDMSRYLLLELARGRTSDGTVWVSEKNLTRRWQPSVKTGEKSSYGLALGVGQVNDVTVIAHDGGTNGFTSYLFFLPDQGIGAVILTNGAGGSLFGPLTRRLMELWFDGRPEADEQLKFVVTSRKTALQRESMKVDRSPDDSWTSTLLGNYSNKSLGKITIRREGGAVVLDTGEWRSKIGRKREEDGTVKVVLLDPPNAGFELIPEPTKGGLALAVELPQQRYVFERGN